ncbi:MAG: hypothetical protein MI748_08630 [Opitutales bacterium]|nr:hypothetical protein [Opitutales bacterium]
MYFPSRPHDIASHCPHVQHLEYVLMIVDQHEVASFSSPSPYRLHFMQQDFDWPSPIIPFTSCTSLAIYNTGKSLMINKLVQFAPSAQDLTLSTITINDHVVSAINALSQLQSLHLNNATITNFEGINLPQLMLISLTMTKINPKNLDHLLAGTPSLQEISLRGKKTRADLKDLREQLASHHPDIKVA